MANPATGIDFSPWSPNNIVCPKCRRILRLINDSSVSHVFNLPGEASSFSVHSKSIVSLGRSRTNDCHLCVQIWEAKKTEFQLLLQNEQAGGTAVSLLYRWEFMDRKYTKTLEQWDHEPKRLRFITSNDLRNFGEWFRDEIERESNRKKEQMIFWMTAVADPPVKRTPSCNLNLIHNTSTGSGETHQLARMWVENCFMNHSCGDLHKARGRWNPTRVLDLEASDSHNSIKLWEPGTGHENITYVTLSHCWGAQTFLLLTVSTYEQFKKHVPSEALTDTFKDAVSTTRKLGIRYLWIDSLCIQQGNEVDWLIEANRMGDVYKYGHCNISAAFNEKSKAGLYVERNPLTVKHLVLAIDNGERPQEPTALYLFHRQFNEWSDIIEATVNTRAWVFQERAISPRTLYFGSNQVFFECSWGMASEAWPMGVDVDWMNMSFEKTWSLKKNFQELLTNSSTEDTKNKQHDGYQELSNWEALMEYYSNCGITEDSDRLIAISGLAEIVRRKTGLEYFAGLFNFQIEKQLLWRVADRNKCERAHGDTATWAPSWSWASVKGKDDNQGKVRLHNYGGFWSKDSAVTTRVTIVSINVATDEGHPCGKLDMKGDNTLEMRGKLTKYYPELGVAASNDQRQFWNVGGVYFDTIDVVPEEAYCFLLLSKTESQRAPNIINRALGRESLGGLILCPTKKRGEFTRCGIFWVPCGGSSKKLQNKFSESEGLARKSELDLPFEKRWGQVEFVVKVV